MLHKISIDQKNQLFIQMIYIFLVVMTLAVFWQINRYDFVNFDDPLYVTENSHLRSGLTPDEIRWAFNTTYADSLWHPLVWLSLMLDYRLFGLNAGGYHLNNLMFHILSTLLLFRLFNRMTGEIWKSAFVAAFFALHPLHVESVAWIAERKDVLSAFFWILTLCFYVDYTKKPSVARYLTVLLSFICALMSKPMVVTLPAIMILLDYWPLNRFDSHKHKRILWQLKEKSPLFLLSVFFSVLTIYTQHDPSIHNFPFGSRFSNSSVAFVSYLKKTFWPHDMAVFYPFPLHIPLWQVCSALLLIIFITFIVFIMMKRMAYLFVGWLWYSIALLPVIGIIQSGEQAMANRYTYLPLIGVSIMLAWGTASLITSEKTRKLLLLPVATVFLIILSVISWRQCVCWKNSITLFSHTLQATKNNALAHHNLGLALFTEGKNKEAIDHFNEAIRLTPGNAISYINRGNCYEALGRYQQAIENYNQALRIKPDFANAYLNTGIIQMKLGLYPKAMDYFNKAIRLKPDYADAYYYKGIAYGKLNQYRFAIDNFNIAIGLDKYYADAYSNRGNAYFNLGRHQRAVEDYNEAIRLKPDHADFYNIRGIAYINLNLYQKAVDDFNEAIRLKPDDADFYNIRGIAYINLNLYQKAVDDFNEAIRLKPDHAMYYYNRGNAYFKSGQYQKAVDDFNEAIRLKPDHADAYNNRGGCYFKLRLYQSAIDDFNKAIRLKPDDADAYNNLSGVILRRDNKESGCYNAQKACHLGNCKALEWAKSRKYCR